MLGLPSLGGTFLGGPAVTPDSDLFPHLAVEVAFTTGAFEEPVWVDISEDVRHWDTTRGRNRELERFQPGRATVVLSNLQRQYDSQNAGGPWSGYLKPMRRIRIRNTFDGVTYTNFDGFIDRWVLDYPLTGKDATATVIATDFSKVAARTDLARSVYTSLVQDAEPEIWWRFDDAGYPTTVLDSSGNGNHGTVVGSPDFQVEPLIVKDGGQAVHMPIDINNPSDKGVNLDLSDHGLTISGATPFAVEFWLRRNPNNGASGAGGVESYFYLTDDSFSATPIRFGAFMNNSTNSKLLWQAVNDAETLNWGVETNFNLDLDTTYHVVLVHGSDRVLRIYVNGVDVSQATGGLSGTTTAGTINADVLKFLERGQVTTPDVIVDEFALYLGTVPSLADFAEHYAAGVAPWDGDSPGERAGRILDLVSLPDDLRELDDGDVSFQSASLGTTALEHLQKVGESEFGLLFVSAAGVVRLIDRESLSARVPLGVFGDTDVDGWTLGSSLLGSTTILGEPHGEVGYRSITFDDGDTVIRNRATISRLDGVARTAEDTGSADEFGRFDYTLDGLLHDDDDYSEDYAEFVVAEYAEPRRRVSQLGVGPANAAERAGLYPQILGRELGDLVRVRHHPPGGGDRFEQTCVVEGVSLSGVPKMLSAVFVLSPAPTTDLF